MGKTGKAAKRRRLMDTAAIIAAAETKSAPDSAGEQDDAVVSSADLAQAVRTIHILGGRLDIFASQRCKALRVALGPLLTAQLAKSGGRKQGEDGNAATAKMMVPSATPAGGLSGRVCDALRQGRWDAAVVALRELTAAGIVPKLGAAQRWVRDCDACRETVPGPRWRCLDMVVRACTARGAVVSAPILTYSAAALSTPACAQSIVVHRMPRFDSAAALRTQAGTVAVEALPPLDVQPVSRSTFTVVSHTHADMRVPPNRYDQTIFAGVAVSLAACAPTAVTSSLVPGVPGAVFITGAVASSECRTLIAMADVLGWVPDETLAVGGGYDDFGASAADELRAGSVVWLADGHFISTLLDRMRPHLPPMLRGDALVGLNARCRLYRYGTDARYRPHLDGAWPGSGMMPDGKYAYDATPGAAYSRLTVVLYLNDGFEGGLLVMLRHGGRLQHVDTHRHCNAREGYGMWLCALQRNCFRTLLPP